MATEVEDTASHTHTGRDTYTHMKRHTDQIDLATRLGAHATVAPNKRSFPRESGPIYVALMRMPPPALKNVTFTLCSPGCEW